MGDEWPGIRIVHLDRDVAERFCRTGEYCERVAIARVEALHVADLDDTAGLVAGGDDVGDFFRRVAERLLAEDMQPTRQRGHDQFVVQRVGGGDDDGVEFLVEKLVGSLEAGHAPGGGDELAGGR